MPAPSGDRFSSASMADCAFCPDEGRRFRTQKQCATCGRPLCLSCRPEIPGVPFLCPDCGGGPNDRALLDPKAACERLAAAGHTVPFWLAVLVERQAAARVDVDELIVPE